MAEVRQEYFTAAQLMRYLGVSKASFYKVIPSWVESGRLAEYVFPGLRGVRYRKSEVDDCFERVERGENKGRQEV